MNKQNRNPSLASSFMPRNSINLHKYPKFFASTRPKVNTAAVSLSDKLLTFSIK